MAQKTGIRLKYGIFFYRWLCSTKLSNFTVEYEKLHFLQNS